jgi:hypothetical protein
MGKGRFTHDVDVTAEVDNDDLAGFFERAGEFGFVPRDRDPIGFARQTRMILLLHQPSAIEVDISMAGLPFESELIDRAMNVELHGVDVPVASPEDLVITKAVAGRPQDLVDIELILASNAGIDLARVRHYLPQFAEALEAPEIVTRFEEVVARWRTDTEQDRKYL